MVHYFPPERRADRVATRSARVDQIPLALTQSAKLRSSLRSNRSVGELLISPVHMRTTAIVGAFGAGRSEMATDDQFDCVKHYIHVRRVESAHQGFGHLLIPNHPRQEPRREAIRCVAVELA
ncbi:hypothetical protein Sar04_37220 [Salinispora arenicola]|uniref:Uncharacterized protein n=1 Tax=Salinispora arenicola TaxID=168697 RepID=A0ABQ4JYD8_SALAC|nr:hypothetical protein Sar04_37220 [Salinispora arenicola]